MSRLLKILIGILVLLAIAAIIAFAVLPAAVERSQNKTLDHEPYVISDEAAAIQDSLRLADLHTDTMLWKRDFLKRGERGHVDLPRLQDSNSAVQVFAAVTKSPSGLNYEENTAESDDLDLLVKVQLWPPRTWNSLLERAVYQSEKLHHFAEDSDGALRVVRTAAEFDAALSAGALAGILATEGAHPLEGDIANLDRLWTAGYRIIGLQHFFDNELGGSLHGVTNAGLTDFGREAVRAIEEKGLIIDLAHSSEAVVEDVLAISNAPLIVSHTGLKGACDTPRNIRDELMVEIARRGGLIGIGYWDAAVCDVSPDGIAQSIRYAADLLGVEHVVYGSDYDGAVTVIMDSGERAALTDALLAQGFTPREIRLIAGESVIRFMRENLPESGQPTSN